MIGIERAREGLAEAVAEVESAATSWAHPLGGPLERGRLVEAREDAHQKIAAFEAAVRTEEREKLQRERLTILAALHGLSHDASGLLGIAVEWRDGQITEIAPERLLGVMDAICRRMAELDAWAAEAYRKAQEHDVLAMRCASAIEQARTDEREACARLIEGLDKSTHPSDAAAAIRARVGT